MQPRRPHLTLSTEDGVELTPDRSRPGPARKRGPALSAALWTLAILGPLVAPGIARAHDVWLEPSTWEVREATAVAIDIVVGEHFEGRPLPRNSGRVVEFAVHGHRESEPLPGVDGVAPAGLLSLEAYSGVGTHTTRVIGYVSNRARVELGAQRFESYLEEEGLEHISRLRRQRSEVARPASESYSRCAKSLISAPSSDPRPAHDRALGCKLEIIPLQDPLQLAAGDRLALRLLLDGEPLEGGLVIALSKSSPQSAQRARSDAAGRVAFTLAEAGPWLIKSVHMEAAEPGLGTDWESWWSSLTFALASE